MNVKKITTFCVAIALMSSFTIATAFAVPSGGASETKSSSTSSSPKAPVSSVVSSVPPAVSSSSTAPVQPPSSQPAAEPQPESSTAPVVGRVTSYPPSAPSSQASSAVSSAISSLPSSSAISMPDVDSGEVSVPQLLGAGTMNPLSDKNKLIGIIAWVCIGLGIVIVLVVLFSSKKNVHGSLGRKRYHRRPYKTHKKRLLDDRYYNARKYR